MRISISRRLLIGIFSLFIVGSVSLANTAFAINENRVNVPQYILDRMAQLGQTGTSGKDCSGFNNIGWSWISYDSDGSIKNSLNKSTLVINDSDNSVKLRLNTLGGYCDSIIDPATGKITNTSLGRSGVSIVGSPRVSVSNPQQSTTGIAITADGLSSGDILIQGYDTAINNNDRYAKGEYAGRPDVMRYQSFELKGLNALPASDSVYTVTITIPTRRVNDFRTATYRTQPRPPGELSRFVCVNNEFKTSNIFGSNNTACPTDELVVTAQIKIAPQYAGECDIREIAGVNTFLGTVPLTPGQRFDARFKVTNIGTAPWSAFFVKMGSFDPLDNTTWGPQRIGIPKPAGPNGFPVIAGQPNPETFEWTTSGGVFTAPSNPGVYYFSWRIVQEGGTGSGYPNKTNMGDCRARVEVKVPENRPFISIAGGDVYSGAAFGDCSVVSDRAKNASINTNGYYGGQLGDGLGGSSHAQYAVFSSGSIGQRGINSNVFRANYGYQSRNPDGSIVTQNPTNPLATTDRLQDALFANYGINSDYYGKFYGSNTTAVPCVSAFSDLVGAQPLATPAEAVAFLNSGSSGVYRVDGDVSVGDVTVGAGSSKTLIINGDLRLNGQITYANQYTTTSIPYLKIVADNIFISRGVQQIDGQLVALPNQTATADGVVDTCSELGGEGQWPSTMTLNSCNTKLRINGSVSARQILWKRTSGTLGRPANGLLDLACYFGRYDANDPGPGPIIQTNDDAVIRYSDCAAERINFSPEAYLKDLGGGPSSVPISTQELPPIY